MDGDELIIAVHVKNEKDGREYWQMDKVIANCDGENFHLMDTNGEYYSAWQWGDVDYFIRVDAFGPMTRKQIEAVS